MIVLTHVPKTGGTTIEREMARALGDPRLRHREGDIRPVKAMSQQERDALLFLSGHIRWNDPCLALFRQAPLFVATVRDPVSRIVSSYAYKRETAALRAKPAARPRVADISLDEYAARLLRIGRPDALNKHCFWFAESATFEDARAAILDRYALVAGMRNLDRLVRTLKQYVLGQPVEPEAKVRRARTSQSASLQLSARLEAELRSRCAEDTKLLAWIDAEQDMLFDRAKAILDPLAGRLLASPG